MAAVNSIAQDFALASDITQLRKQEKTSKFKKSEKTRRKRNRKQNDVIQNQTNDLNALAWELEPELQGSIYTESSRAKGKASSTGKKVNKSSGKPR